MRKRFVFRDTSSNTPKYEAKCSFTIDPFLLIDEIVFDPRMPDYEVECYKDELARLDVNFFNRLTNLGAPKNIKIRHSKLYSLPEMKIKIDFSDFNI